LIHPSVLGSLGILLLVAVVVDVYVKHDDDDDDNVTAVAGQRSLSFFF